MNKKLTLLLDEKIIEQAKEYASKKNESLSGIVAKYFSYIAGNYPPKNTDANIEKEIEEIVGIVQLPSDIDIRKEYREHRAMKGLHD